MDEYINRRKAAEVVCKLICGSDRGLCVSTPENCQQEKMLEFYKIPAEDVAPVVHGKWEKHGPYDSIGGDWMKSQQCSVCYALYVSPGNTPWEHHKYCPNCGAKMDGGE